MSVATERAAVDELVAAARRDLAEVEAALARPDEDWDGLVVLVLFARAARRMEDATFALLEAHARSNSETPVVTRRTAP